MIQKAFLLTDLGNGNFKLSGFPTHPHHLYQGKYVGCLPGCCAAIRRKIFDTIRFDENLQLYSCMEDVDISKKICDLGYKIYYEPGAEMEHKLSPRGRLTDYQIKRMLVTNHYYLFKKNWPQILIRKIAFWWSILGLLLRSMYARNIDHIQGTISGVIDIFSNRGELVVKAKKIR